MTDSPGARKKRYDAMNLAVVSLQVAGWALLISLLHRDLFFPLKAGVLLVFCLMMQGVFSMIHEAIHKLAHSNGAVNYGIGVVAALIFGTSFTLFEVNHEGHHVRNRTRPELVDFILPGESRAKKTLVYYFGIVGGIWLGGFIGSILLPFIPFRFRNWLSWNREDNTFTTAVTQFKQEDWRRLRWELLFGVFFWTVAIRLFDWHWQVLLTAYLCFAFSWSSLQWVYHIGTPIHVVEGAYNLRLPTWIRWLFLNFNYNLTHHRDPLRPWQELAAVSNPRETQPLWYRYLRLFLWPQPLPEDVGAIRKTYF